MNKAFNPQFWVAMAEQIAKASTCRVEVGCVIVRRNELVGAGYVGSVSGEEHCQDVGCLFVETTVTGHEEKKRSCIRTVHAEMNAVLRCMVRGSERDGWLMAYATHAPCLNCLKALLQVGVRDVWFKKPYRDAWRDELLVAMDKTTIFVDNDGLTRWSFNKVGRGK